MPPLCAKMSLVEDEKHKEGSSRLLPQNHEESQWADSLEPGGAKQRSVETLIYCRWKRNEEVPARKWTESWKARHWNHSFDWYKLIIVRQSSLAENANKQ